MNLRGKRILLTGATGGLGQEVAMLLAEKGAMLTLVGRDNSKLNQLINRLEKTKNTHFCVVADLNEQGVIMRIVDEAKQKMGGIDVLINNAGILDFIKLEQQSETRIAQMIHTNITAPVQLTRAITNDFLAKTQGHIVFVGSIFGSLGFPYFSTYCATKFAVHGFSQALRRELSGTNIGVTYIAPRGIDTPLNVANTVAMWEKSGSKIDAPQQVAKIIVTALEKQKQEVFIGQPESFFAWLNGVFPKAVNYGLKKSILIARQFL